MFQVRTPLILLGMSMELNASNWSWALKAEGDISLQMNYYNESISVWEPVSCRSSYFGEWIDGEGYNILAYFSLVLNNMCYVNPSAGH